MATSRSSTPATYPASSSQSTYSFTANTTTNTAMSTNTDTSSASAGYVFPPHYSFPPFFTLQPNLTTRSSQLASWSSHITSYCAHHALFALSLSTALATPLFANTSLGRRLPEADARTVLEYMASTQGGSKIEWLDSPAGGQHQHHYISSSSSSSNNDSSGSAKGRERCLVWWRSKEDWAGAVERWVEGTGQRGSVLTVYELLEGDASRSAEWRGMERDVFNRVLAVCVKRGKAATFGVQGGEGVKFF